MIYRFDVTLLATAQVEADSPEEAEELLRNLGATAEAEEDEVTLSEAVVESAVALEEAEYD